MTIAVTSDDAIPDREQLQQSGVRRTRRGTLISVIMVAGLLLLTPVVLEFTDPDAHRSAPILLLGLIPAVLVLAIVLPMVWWLRRRHPQWQTPPLSAGAQRNTRRAVQRAIRTGNNTPDARVNALAREQAEKTVRNTRALKIYAGILVLQLGPLILRIADGGSKYTLMFAVLGDALWASALVVLAVNLSRARRYLRDHPPENEPR